MRRNEKRHRRPTERLHPQTAPLLPSGPLLPGAPLVEEALPGRLLVLMSRLHRRERLPPEVRPARGDEAAGACPPRHSPPETVKPA